MLDGLDYAEHVALSCFDCEVQRHLATNRHFLNRVREGVMLALQDNVDNLLELSNASGSCFRSS